MKQKEMIREAIAQGCTPTQVNHLRNNCTINQLFDVLEELLTAYDHAPDLLTAFFQSKSDACVLECSDQEQMEQDFKGWLFEQQTK